MDTDAPATPPAELKTELEADLFAAIRSLADQEGRPIRAVIEQAPSDPLSSVIGQRRSPKHGPTTRRAPRPLTIFVGTDEVLAIDDDQLRRPGGVIASYETNYSAWRRPDQSGDSADA